MTRSTVLPLAGLLFALTAGCSPDQTPERSSDQALGSDQNLGPGQVAVVNDQPIAESLFRLYGMNVTQRGVDDLTPEQRQAILDDLIDFTLVAQAAEERGLLRERAIAAELALQRLQLTANLMGQRYLEENPPTEAELRTVYEENLPRLAGVQYRAQHILTPSEAEAQAIIDELDAGADFAEAARTGSHESSDLGWFSPDSTVPAFAAAIRAMETGTYSTQPVETQYGWHVILLEDTRQQEPPSFETLRSELRDVVDRRKVEAFIESLREEASIDMLTAD